MMTAPMRNQINRHKLLTELTSVNAPIQKTRALRPKDAATIMLIDRSSAELRVLMGKRSNKHAFMPSVFVFPGGRRDRNDWRLPVSKPLHQGVLELLLRDTHKRFSPKTAQALANAAARELGEETGLLLNDDKNGYDLSKIRYFARAVTPIGQNRRFDTRFFVCFCDEMGLNTSKMQDSDELSELMWVNINNPGSLPLPDITRTVLGELNAALHKAPNLPFRNPVISFMGDRKDYFIK